MSLGRLLATGKSLVGLRNGETRYREDKRVRLPKFISPKNPFAPPEKPADAPVAEAGPEVKPVVEPVRLAAPQTELPKPAGTSVRQVNWLGDWRQRLNPFRTRKPAPRPDQASRQGELALERVRVLHNDLRDADRAERAGDIEPAKPLLPVMSATLEKLEPVNAAWNRLTAKFVGTDQS